MVPLSIRNRGHPSELSFPIVPGFCLGMHPQRLCLPLTPAIQLLPNLSITQYNDMLPPDDLGQIIQPLLSLGQPFLFRPSPNFIQTLSINKPFPQFFKLLCGQAHKHWMNRIRADLKTPRNLTGQKLHGSLLHSLTTCCSSLSRKIYL